MALAAAGLLAAEVIRGAHQFETFNKAMLLTSGQAGLTSASFSALAQSIATSANTTIGGSIEALQSVVATGVFGPKMLPATTEAVARLSALTGKTAEEVAADFAKMADGVTKYAAEHAKQNHVISSSQYEQIRALEDAGKAEQAQGIYLDSLNEHLRAHDKEIGAVGGFWLEAKKQASGYVQAILDLGKGSSIDRQVEIAQSRLQRLQDAKASSGATVLDPLIAEQQKTIDSLFASQHLAQQVATAQAAYNQRQDKGRNAGDFLAELDKDTKGATRLSKALDELHVKQAEFRAAGNVLTPDRQKAEEDEVRKRNTPAPTRKDRSQDQLDNRFTAVMGQLGEDKARLDAQTASWLTWGKAVESTKVAVIEFDLAQGKLTGKNGAALTMAERQSVLARAAAVDAEEERVSQFKAVDAINKRATAIAAAASAEAMNSRQVRIANELQDLNASKVDKTSKAYTDAVAVLTAAVNADANNKLTRELAEQQQAVDAEIVRMREEADAVGMSTLEREKLTAALKLQAQAQKDIAANPGQAGEINDAMVAKQKQIGQALDERFAKETSGYAGVKIALQDYRDKAANASTFAQGVVSGGLDRLTNDVDTFAETGKARFGDVFKFMADEFIRNFDRMEIAQLTTSAGGNSILSGITGAIGKYFGAGDVTQSGSAASAQYGEQTFAYYGGHALGGDVKAGGAYLVGEHGPEMLYTGGQSGRIVSNSDLRAAASRRSAANDGGSPGQTNVTVINNGSNTKASAQTVQQPGGNKEVQVMIEDVVIGSIGSGGRVHDAMAKRYGLNAGGAVARR